MRIIILIGLMALIASCSLKMRIEIVNSSGHPVQVVSGKKVMNIPSGGAIQFDYPSVSQDRRFQIFIGECEYFYEAPSAVEKYVKLKGFNGVVVLQLRNDAWLRLVFPDKDVSEEISDEEIIQIEGFPVIPIGMTCV